MTRVLVTGISGQLGAELMRASWPTDVDVLGVARSELDLSRPNQIAEVVHRIAPDVIINAAAYTAVDQAEDEPILAHTVNGDAVAELARVAAERGAWLLHLSTDYVFDGLKSDWYIETDETRPTGVYGASKLVGEEAVATYERGMVFRTAWVYGALGNNFVRTMLRLASQRSELGVVADQIGCPSAAVDLANALVEVVRAPDRRTQSIYHLASIEPASWFGFARAVLLAQIRDGLVTVNPLHTHEFPTKAVRPPNSRLDSSAMARDFGTQLPRWSTTMPKVRAEIIDRGVGS